jgi:trimeric autotransporter adhesin
MGTRVGPASLAFTGALFFAALGLLGCGDPLSIVKTVSEREAEAPPPVPAGLSVGNPTASTLTVSWNATVRAASYEVRSDFSPTGPFTTVAYQGPATQFADAITGRMSPSYYKVRAINSYGPGSFSGTATGMIGYLIDTVAGSDSALMGDGLQATAAQLITPGAVAFDSSGNMYIADMGNARVRVVDHSTGIISTFAGTTAGPAAGDGGLATAAKLNQPQGLAFDAAGNLYIADTGNNRVRKVDTGGYISTFAGTTAGFGGDTGQATLAQLHTPMQLAFYSGSLYIADESNHRIRKVDGSGVITTVAGNGTAAYNGDGIAATSASLNWACGVAFDLSGNLYIADQGNDRIRKVDTLGVISTVAGTGVKGFAGDDGPATSAQFDWPMGVVVASSGNLYIADQVNNRIRKITKSTGIITTIAGCSPLGFSGDAGPALVAHLHWPCAVAIGGSNIYAVDQANNRVRLLY